MTASVSVVSGGSRGLGLAIVEALLARGDSVATFSRSGSPALDALVAGASGRLHAARLDAGDAPSLRDFVASVVDRFGRIDHCVANAAVAHEGVLATTRDDEIDSMLTVNVRGVIILVRECVRQMLVEHPRDRSITVLSSVVARRGSRGLAVYAATKAAVEAFAASLARELGPRGIRVNSVAPGYVETDLSSSLAPADRQRIVRRTPLGRLGEKGDVAAAVSFLASPAAGFITAQTVAVDGGFSG